METVLRGTKKTVKISSERPFVIIGEKINPTGRKKMVEALHQRDLTYIRELALSQVKAGADVLDVNVGLPELNAVALMQEILPLLVEWVEVPLCLDSPDPAVLAAGLALAPGKALINSVTGEEERLKNILPLVKDHQAAVIGLIIDDSGIPTSAEARLKVAESILNRAVQMGIPAEDVIIDPLAMAVAADSQAGLITLNAIHLIHDKLGVNMSMGASNVSHGLPDRPLVNQAFMALAMGFGVTCAITDPLKMTSTVRALDLLLGKDEDALRYMKNFRLQQALLAQSAKENQ
ncbi:MAG TPA: dihydropteroate synthase [Anaerolineaceae bacterium]